MQSNGDAFRCCLACTLFIGMMYYLLSMLLVHPGACDPWRQCDRVPHKSLSKLVDRWVRTRMAACKEFIRMA